MSSDALRPHLERARARVEVFLLQGKRQTSSTVNVDALPALLSRIVEPSSPADAQLVMIGSLPYVPTRRGRAVTL